MSSNKFQPSLEASSSSPLKKLRTACDVCHQNKTKCSGQKPCVGCLQAGIHCFYSVSNRIGRPKGARNKKTLDRASHHQSGITVPKNYKQRDTPLQGQPPATFQWPEEIMNGSMLSPANTESETSKGTTFIEAPRGNNADNALFPTNDEDLWSFFESLGSCNDATSSSLTSIRTSMTPQYGCGLISPAASQGEESGAGNDVGSTATLCNDGSPCVSQNIRAIWDKSIPLAPPTQVSPVMGDNNLPNPIPTGPQSCSCLRQNTDLLCRLKSLKERHTTLSIDVLLVGADQALASWKSLLQCRTCQQNEDQEVLLLSALSIRVILRNLQVLCLGCEERDGSDGEMLMSSNHDGKVTASSCRTTGLEKRDSVRSTIGVYEVTGVERILVTDLLISRTLGKIKVVLRCLQERSESARQKHLANNLNLEGENVMDGDIEPLQQLLKGLDKTVQRLMRWVRSSGSGTGCDYANPGGNWRSWRFNAD